MVFLRYVGSKLLRSRLLVVCRLMMGSRLLVELGSKGVLFMFLLVEVVEFSLMLGSKVLQKYKFCKVEGSRVLLVHINLLLLTSFT